MIPTVCINVMSYHLDKEGRLKIIKYSKHYHQTMSTEFDKSAAIALKNYLNNYLR